MRDNLEDQISHQTRGQDQAAPQSTDVGVKGGETHHSSRQQESPANTLTDHQPSMSEDDQPFVSHDPNLGELTAAEEDR